MFQSITFRDQNEQDATKPIDIGMLVECMLFYDKTNVIATHGILKQLLIDFGIDNLIELTEEGFLKIMYAESFTGIKTEKNALGIEFHAPVIFSSPQHMFQDVIRKNCIEVSGKEGKGRRLARRLERNVEVIHHDIIVTQGAKESFLDQEYIKKAIPIAITRLLSLPEIPTDIEFATEDTPIGVVIHSNINYIQLNEFYNKKFNTLNSTISPASLLGNLYDVEFDLYYASSLLSEIATSSIGSDLMIEKLEYLVNRGRKSKEAINQFNKLILNDTKTLRESVNARKVDMQDVVKLIKKSRKFKDWLRKQSPNSDLLNEYYNAVTKETFLDKLPGKTSRWAIFAGLGLAADSIATCGFGTATGLALSALDGFFVDRLIKGWNPSQFIEGNLRPTLKKVI